MIPRPQIETFVREVVRQFQPEKIVLFGSYAGGAPTGDSDVDLLVVMRYHGHSAQQAARIRQRVRAGFPLDLIVRSPAKIRQRLKMGDGFIREVIEKGRVLYETAHS